jgi:hypothetical protein
MSPLLFPLSHVSVPSPPSSVPGLTVRLCSFSSVLCTLSHVSVPCLPPSVPCLTSLFIVFRPLSPLSHDFVPCLRLLCPVSHDLSSNPPFSVLLPLSTVPVSPSWLYSTIPVHCSSVYRPLFLCFSALCSFVSRPLFLCFPSFVSLFPVLRSYFSRP